MQEGYSVIDTLHTKLHAAGCTWDRLVAAPSCMQAKFTLDSLHVLVQVLDDSLLAAMYLLPDLHCFCFSFWHTALLVAANVMLLSHIDKLLRRELTVLFWMCGQ